MTIKSHGDGPGSLHFNITPSDTVAISPTPRALYVLTNGTLVIGDSAGNDITYPVTAGQILPFRAKFVKLASVATVVGWN